MEVEDRRGCWRPQCEDRASHHIKNMEARTEKARTRASTDVEINDLKHLEKVMKSLRGVEGVIGVERARRAG